MDIARFGGYIFFIINTTLLYFNNARFSQGKALNLGKCVTALVKQFKNNYLSIIFSVVNIL